MLECLGISVSNKMIKYAKVQNENNKFKIVSYGIKFYEELKLKSTIEQIIQETNSTKTPISINIKSCKYYYFDVFKMTNKDYLKKAVQTEFESYCIDNHLNKDAFIGKYFDIRELEDNDKTKIIYAYDKKSNINEIKNSLGKYNLHSIVPEETTLANLLRLNRNKNTLIVDLDDKAKVTVLIAGDLYDVETLKSGMGDAFDAINEKENSYSKTYEVCKNTTIYTMEAISQGINATQTQNEYLKNIVPELYKIAMDLQNVVSKYQRIDEIYLTGYGSVINNVDLYFQEYFKEAKVEILKPFFADSDKSVNLKDYIEVNSAIGLALSGMGYGLQNFNFKSNDFWKNLKGILTTDVSTLSKKQNEQGDGNKIAGAFKKVGSWAKDMLSNATSSTGKMTSYDTSLITSLAFLIIVIVMFSGFSYWLTNKIKNKMNEAEQTISYTKNQEALVAKDDSTIKNKTQDYIRYKSNLEDTSTAIEEKRSRKNQITNLLSKIAYTIPKGVTLTEIKNTEATGSSGETVQHITITARASEYQQLAYFKAKLKNADILENVVSTQGERSGTVVTTTIEGDLASY